MMLQQLFGLCRASDTHTAFAEAQIQHLVYTPSFFQQSILAHNADIRGAIQYK